MATLYVMVGIPGSGKSTYAKSHKNENDIYVSRDEIRFSMLKDGEDYFSHEDDVLKEFFSRINEGLNSGHNVWADATHITYASREKLFSHVTSNYDSCIGVIMRTPFQVCRHRNFLREGRAFVAGNVMNRMYHNYEEPNSNEPFTDFINVYVEE